MQKFRENMSSAKPKTSKRKNYNGTRRHSSRKSPGPDFRKVVSRKEINAVTMNMAGRIGLGLTPRYKIDMAKEYLASNKPDVILIQDCIDCADMIRVLEEIGNGTYGTHFIPDRSEFKIKGESDDDDDEEDNTRRDEEGEERCVSAIVWNKTKYIGVPLKVDDKRLGGYAGWLKKHNVAIVKLDSAQRAKQGTEDVFPSFIAISWLGPDYQCALKERRVTCVEFFKFLTLLRKNNWHIPILIGGDFNMDMRSFDFQNYSDFMCVPYRPVSGSMARDLKNTFLFTVDSLQVTETALKQFHPEIYPNPFITVRVRGRTRIKIWAIVKIQRTFRAYLKRAKERRKGNKKLKESKKRWMKKIEGDNYVSEPDSDDEVIVENKFSVDSNGTPASAISRTVGTAKQLQNLSVGNYRRKKYADLKSVHEKKKESAANEAFARSLRPPERFEF